MCRLLAYLGKQIPLYPLLYQPQHSLVVQSYQPREMISGVVNADGFGVGWYGSDGEAFSYRHTIPIWNDVNLPGLSRFIQSNCLLAYVRSATPGQALDLSNSQPFNYKNLLFIHNGRIDNFRQKLYRKIRATLSNEIYSWIGGSTDSEHILALILNYLQANPDWSVETALHSTLLDLQGWAEECKTNAHINVVISDGQELVAARYTTNPPAPSLYWIRHTEEFPNSVIVASEPLFRGDWQSFSENSIIRLGDKCDIRSQKV